MKSKAPSGKRPQNIDISIGDLVYVHGDRNKHKGRVTSKEGQWLHIKKFTGSQLRSNAYRVKQSECYQVPMIVADHFSSVERNTDGEEEVQIQSEINTSTAPVIPSLPVIPAEIATPPPIEEVEDTTTPVDSPVRECSEEDTVPLDICDSTVKDVRSITYVNSNRKDNRDVRRSSRAKKSPMWLNDFVQ